MKKAILIICETLIIILIILGIFAIIYSSYFIFKDSGKIVLNINKLEKIQFFLVFNDYEFTLYYKNKEEIKLYDDLYDLREYIEEKGTSREINYIVGDGLILLIIFFLNFERKKLADKIST